MTGNGIPTTRELSDRRHAETEAPITDRILFLNASLVFWGFKVPRRLAEKYVHEKASVAVPL